MKETVSFRIFSARKEEKDKGRCRLVINLFKRSGFRTFRKFMSSRVGTAHTLLPESGLGSNIGPATYQLPDPGLDLRAPRSMSQGRPPSSTQAGIQSPPLPPSCPTFSEG